MDGTAQAVWIRPSSAFSLPEGPEQMEGVCPHWGGWSAFLSPNSSMLMYTLREKALPALWTLLGPG